MKAVSKSKRAKRWEILDRILSQGRPVSVLDIYKTYLESPDPDINHGASGIRKTEPSQMAHNLKVKYNDSFRKDMVLFKQALRSAGQEDMLLIQDGVQEKECSSGVDHRTRTYCYRQPGFSILPLLNAELSDAEYRKLVTAIERLKGVIGEQNFSEIRFALRSRIESDFGKGPNCVVYEENKRLKGREHLPIIYNAILSKQALLIEYQKFNGQKLGPFEFIPFLLKQYNERWFAFGRRLDDNLNAGDHYSIPVDRILSAPSICGTHEESVPENYLDYFSNIVGVTNRRGRVERVEIRITNIDTWGRAVTKPLPTQEVLAQYDKKKGYGILKLDVIPNEELYSKLLSWGGSVEVLSPSRVREKMKETLSGLLRNYERDSKGKDC